MKTTFRHEINSYHNCPDEYKESYLEALEARRKGLKKDIEKMKGELYVVNKTIQAIKNEKVGYKYSAAR